MLFIRLSLFIFVHRAFCRFVFSTLLSPFHNLSLSLCLFSSRTCAITSVSFISLIFSLLMLPLLLYPNLLLFCRRFSITLTLLLHSRYSFSLAYPSAYFSTLSFFSHSVPLSHAKLSSVSFTRYLVGLLLGFARAALISLPWVSPSHLHSRELHSPLSSFSSSFASGVLLFSSFFHVFTTAVELFSLLYLLLLLILVSDSFLARTFRPTLSGISPSFSSIVRPSFSFAWVEGLFPRCSRPVKNLAGPKRFQSRTLRVNMRISVKLFIGFFKILHW